MNKKIWIWLSVLVLSVGAVIGLAVSLTRQQDQVEIIEEFSYGDKTVVEGLTVWARMGYGYQDFWEITHTMGEQGETVVRTYTWEERDQIPSITKSEYKEFDVMQSGANSTEHTIEGKFSKVNGLDAMVADVAGRTARGTTHQETLKYSDYMEYYPMYMTLFFGDIYSKEGNEYVKMVYDWHLTPAFAQAFHRFFRIPVIPESQVTISVTKDQDGKVIAEEMERDSITPWSIMASVETETGWYFGFHDGGEGRKIDTSHIPGGEGIYYMPVEEENGYRCVRPERLSTVISLEEIDYVYGLYTDESQETLFVSVWQEDRNLLYIYDLATMEMIQKLDMNEYGALGGIEDVYPFDDFLLIDSNMYWLLERQESGRYELKFRVPQTLTYEQRVLGRPKGVYLEDAVIDYNGEQLLIGGWRFGESSEDSQKKDGFYLSLYDETGLIYYGLYKTSLDTGRSYEDMWYACEPDGYDNFHIAWE